MPAVPSRCMFTISHFIFLGHNLPAFKHVITLHAPTPRLTVPGCGARPQVEALSAEEAAVVGRARHPDPQPGWARATCGQTLFAGPVLSVWSGT